MLKQWWFVCSRIFRKGTWLPKSSISTYCVNFRNCVLALIAPPRCITCSSLLHTRALFCEQCHQTLVPVLSTKIALSRTKEVTVFAAGAYQDILKKLILAKHTGNTLAATYLAHLIWYKTPLACLPVDYIIPIPLHWTRHLYRGYNQSHEIALTLSHLHKKPVASLLKRKKRTAFQTTLSAQDRALNLQDAFVLTAHERSLYQDKHLVIIDDLLTTGATLTSACRVLTQLKPASITCVVAARTI